MDCFFQTCSNTHPHGLKTADKAEDRLFNESADCIKILHSIPKTSQLSQLPEVRKAVIFFRLGIK